MFQKQVLINHAEYDNGASVTITEVLTEELSSVTRWFAYRLEDGRWFVNKSGESLIENGRGMFWSAGPPEGPTNQRGAYEILYRRAMNDAVGKCRYHLGWE